MPLVSILIPCYNAAPWLAQTLESALGQTARPTEIIVVDDGSRDDSLALARSFAGRGVTVLSQPNLGAAAARNHALRRSTGEYVQFLDADDIIAPDKIARQLERLASAAGGFIAAAAWGRFQSEPEEATFKPEPTWRDLSGLEFQLLHAEAGWMMQPGAWLCPRAVLDAAGPWDERITLNDDGEYFSRVMLAACGILFCADARLYYRSAVPGSLSRRSDRRALESLTLSTALNADRLLTAGGATPRVRAAAANLWQRLACECVPGAPDLADEAERRCADLGGSPFPRPGTGNFHRLSRVIGWRNARRILHALGRA